MIPFFLLMLSREEGARSIFQDPFFFFFSVVARSRQNRLSMY